MVKNHQHGAIGAVKHGSGDHLRDQVAKRSRLGDAATEGFEPAQHERLAAVCAREHVHLTSEIAEGSAFGALIEALSAPHCRATTVDMQRLGSLAFVTISALGRKSPCFGERRYRPRARKAPRGGNCVEYVTAAARD